MEELKVCIYKKFNQALLTLFTSTGAENIPSNGPLLLEEFAVLIQSNNIVYWYGHKLSCGKMIDDKAPLINGLQKKFCKCPDSVLIMQQSKLSSEIVVNSCNIIIIFMRRGLYFSYLWMPEFWWDKVTK